MNKKLKKLIESLELEKPLIEVLKEQGISEEGIRQFAEMKANEFIRRYVDE
jgi:hypothetical protein